MHQGADVTCVTQYPGIIIDRPGLVTILQIKSSPRETPTPDTKYNQETSYSLRSDLNTSQTLFN